MTDIARWRHLEDLFSEVRTLTARRRQAVLDVRGVASDVRAELDRLLAADDERQALGIERFLDDPPRQTGAPRRIGPWQTLEVIGTGGMGTVWLGERADGAYEQRVAIKVAHDAGHEHGMAAADNERRLLARVTHPNIARLLDAGATEDGLSYMVMDLVEGEPWLAYCDRHRLDVRQRLALFLTVCDAVQHAHQALVVHGDLKPSNILVTADGRIRLVDFGVGRLLGAPPHGNADAIGAVGATPAYASPEQLRGEPISTTTDVHALGLLLHELLVGARAADAASGASPTPDRRGRLTSGLLPSQHVAAWQRADAARADEAAAARDTRPQALVRRLRGDLDAIVRQATRGAPGDRYPTVAALAHDVQRVMDGYPVTARPRGRAGRLRALVGRHRLLTAGSVVITLLLVSVLALGVLHVHALTQERARVALERDRATAVVRVLVDLFQTANPEVVPGGDRQTIAEFLTQAQARAASSLRGQPAIAARVQHALGLAHAARSDHATARGLLTSALDLHRTTDGPDGVDTLAVQLDLAELLAWLHEPRAAAALAEDADARLVRHHGAVHPLRTLAFQVRADVATTPELARGHLEEAVRLARATLPRDDPRRIRRLNALATARLREGRHDEADGLFSEALADAARVNGGRAPVTIGVLTNRAALDLARGDARAAEARHREALALAIDVVGPDSFQVANALNNLAVAAANQGRYAEAVTVLRDSHDRHVRLFGTDHPRTINAARNVGMAFFLADRADDCVAWMQPTSEQRRRVAGRDDASAAYMGAQLARCLARSGHVGEAIGLFDAALPVLEAAGQPAAGYLANVRLWLGTLLVERGDVARAGSLMRAAVDHQRTQHAATHPARVEAECELTHLLRAEGRTAEARAAAVSCVARLSGASSMPTWRAAAVRGLAADR